MIPGTSLNFNMNKPVVPNERASSLDHWMAKMSESFIIPNGQKKAEEKEETLISGIQAPSVVKQEATTPRGNIFENVNPMAMPYNNLSSIDNSYENMGFSDPITGEGMFGRVGSLLNMADMYVEQGRSLTEKARAQSDMDVRNGFESAFEKALFRDQLKTQGYGVDQIDSIVKGNGFSPFAIQNRTSAMPFINDTNDTDQMFWSSILNKTQPQQQPLMANQNVKQLLGLLLTSLLGI